MLETIIGGWKIVAPPADLPQKLATGFKEAFKDFVGADYVPLLYVANQLVNGTNYMFICKGTLVTEQPYEFVAKIILNEDLKGKFSIVSISEI